MGKQNKEKVNKMKELKQIPTKILAELTIKNFISPTGDGENVYYRLEERTTREQVEYLESINIPCLN